MVEIDGDVVLSACKKADDREGLVLRYFNPSVRETDVCISLVTPVREAWLLNLREEREEKLTVENGRVRRTLRAHGIETIEIRA